MVLQALAKKVIKYFDFIIRTQKLIKINPNLVDQWHLDSVGYVIVVLISDSDGLVGGELQVMKRDRSDGALEILNSVTSSYKPSEILTVNYSSAGNAVFMQGSHIYHQVTEVLEAPKGPRISLVNSYMNANVFDEDWTKFSTFRDGDPQHITYLEYARLVAWRARGMLDYLVNKVEFDDSTSNSPDRGKCEAARILKATIDELKNGVSLISGLADDLIGYYDSSEKQIKGYKTQGTLI